MKETNQQKHKHWLRFSFGFPFNHTPATAVLGASFPTVDQVSPQVGPTSENRSFCDTLLPLKLTSSGATKKKRRGLSHRRPFGLSLHLAELADGSCTSRTAASDPRAGRTFFRRRCPLFGGSNTHWALRRAHVFFMFFGGEGGGGGGRGEGGERGEGGSWEL